MDTAQKSLSTLVVDDDILQTKVNLFFRELQDLGIQEEQIKAIGEQLIVLVSDHVIVKVKLLMSDEEWEKWKKFVDTGANSAQQAIVLDKLLNKKISKSFDDLNTEIADELMQNILESIRNRKDLAIKLSKLTDEEVVQATTLLEEGKFDELDALLNKDNISK